MRSVKIGTLQWIVGTFCALMGALMLVAPHQFAGAAYAALRPHMSWLGALFLLGGAGLVGVAALAVSRTVLVLAHLLAGGALLSLAGGFMSAGQLPSASNYTVLALATAGAPLLTRLCGRSSGPGDLFSATIGLAATLNGVYLAFMPAQFQSSIFDLVRPYLAPIGGAFIAAGLGLIACQFRPSLSSRLVWSSHLALAAVLLTYCAMVAVPSGSWARIAYYGGFGLLLVLLPWLAARLRGADVASLRMQLALALVGAAALPLIAMAALLMDSEERSVAARELALQQSLAMALAEDLAGEIGDYEAVVAGLAGVPGLAGMSPEAQRDLLRSVGQVYPNTLSFAIVDVTGRQVASSVGFVMPPEIRSRLADALDRRNAPLVEASPSPETGRVVVTFLAPLAGSAPRPSGAVVGILDSARLAEHLDHGGIGAGARAYIVDSTGRVLVHPDPATAPSFLNLAGFAPVRALLSKEQVPGSLRYSDRGGEQFAGYALVPRLGWGVVVTRPAGAVLASVRTNRDVAAGALLLVIALAAAVGLLVAGRLASPLAILTRAVEKLSAGDAAAPLPRSRIGEVAQLSAAFGDLRDSLEVRTAERMRAEEALRASEERLESILDSLDEMVWSASPATLGMLYVSAAAETIYGRPLDEFYHNPDVLEEAIHQDDQEWISLARQQLVDAGVQEMEYRIVRPDGEVRWVHERRRAVRDAAGRVIRIDGIVADITVRKALADEVAKLEARREADRLKSEFVSIASHEFRTPLASLVGFTELLLCDEVDETERRTWIETMHTEGTRLSHLVEELLDVSRIEDGRVDLNCRPVELRSVVERVLATLQGRSTDHRIEQRLGHDLPPLLADADKLEQVLVNLVSNAIKYSPDGGSVTIAAEACDGRVTISVADQGLGLPADQLPLLFGRFHRIQDSEREGIVGTGLGLYICKQLVELQQGRIWAESPGPGQGSTFYVELPAGVAEMSYA